MTKQWSLLSLLLWTVASVAASGDVQKPILEDAGKPAPADLAVPSPSPSPSPSSSSPPHEPRKLKGRFLHITDIHLDPNYRPGTKPSKACHRLSTSSRSGNKGGLLGNPGTKCDSPPSLLDATFDWIRDHLLDDIDFIVWTGDAARHDNDARVPRSFDEVLELNEVVVRHIREFFTHNNTDAGDGDGDGRKHMRVPFVPNIGNNDFMPHNMFPGAPNQWTVAFGRLWSDFIPASQQPAFVDGGGWFSVEVIPGKLAVISLNTMYFFDLNEAVDGCYGRGEPGYEHFEWLRGELQGMRERGVKAVLIGHVPPARAGKKRGWSGSCWQKYTLWMRQYRDVVVGSLYGHMNLDHFILQDFEGVKIGGEQEEGVGVEKRGEGWEVEGDEEEEDDGLWEDDGDDEDQPVSVQYNLDNSRGRVKYLDKLRKQWYNLPKMPSLKGTSERSAEDPSDSPSMDSTDEDDTDTTTNKKKRKQKQKKQKKQKKQLKTIGGPFAERFSASLVGASLIPNYFPSMRVIEYNISGLHNATVWPGNPSRPPPFVAADFQDTAEDLDEPTYGPDKKKKGKKGKKVPPFKVPDAPSDTSLPGPAYSNQPLTWLSYTQYYANLTRIEEEMSNDTTPPRVFDEGDHGNKTYPPNFRYDVLYDTAGDSVFGLEDLTVRSFLGLAKRIGKGYKRERKARLGKMTGGEGKGKGRNRVWKAFMERAFTGMYGVEDLEGLME